MSCRNLKNKSKVRVQNVTEWEHGNQLVRKFQKGLFEDIPFEKNLSEVRECAVVLHTSPLFHTARDFPLIFLCLLFTYPHPLVTFHSGRPSTAPVPCACLRNLYIYIQIHINKVSQRGIVFILFCFVFLQKMESYLPFPGTCASYPTINHDHHLCQKIQA